MLNMKWPIIFCYMITRTYMVLMTVVYSTQCLPNNFLHTSLFHTIEEVIVKQNQAKKYMYTNTTFSKHSSHPLGCASSSLSTVCSQNSNTRWSFLFRRNTSSRLTRFPCLSCYYKERREVPVMLLIIMNMKCKQEKKWWLVNHAFSSNSKKKKSCIPQLYDSNACTPTTTDGEGAST